MNRTLSQGYLRSTANSNTWVPIVTIVFAVALALLLGAMMALGSTPLALLAVSALLVPVVIGIPSSLLVASFLLVSFVIVGVVQYFGSFRQAHWFPSLLLAAMLVRVPVEFFRSRTNRTETGGISLITVVLWSFVAVFWISIFFNSPPIMQNVVGAKHYLFPLALVALIAISPLSRSFLIRLWKSIPYLLILQFPVCAYQYFIVAGRRSTAFAAGGISWDAVVGTFGGDPDGGGNSGALALVLAFGIPTVLALRRAKLVSARLTWISIICATATMLLAEIKVLIVFVPLAILVHQRHRIFRSPFNALAWLLTSAAFGAALLSVYSAAQWSQAGGQQRTLTEAIEFTFKAEENVDSILSRTGEVSRGGALLRWWNLNPGRGDIAETLFGHGPSGSKFSSLYGRGTSARKHPFTLTTSSASMLLWDLGILGFGLFAFGCVYAFVQIIREAGRIRLADPSFAAVLDSCAVGVALIGCGLVYSSDAVNTAPIQALLALILGLAASQTLQSKVQPRQIVRRSAVSRYVN